MKILGITGGTGSGKTTLLRCVERRGGVVIDCDALYHELLQSDAALLEGISTRFPGVIAQGVLDRKKLGKLVFGDAAALCDLNRITHGAVCRAVREKLDAARRDGTALAAVDAIALFESGLAARVESTGVLGCWSPSEAQPAPLFRGK